MSSDAIERDILLRMKASAELGAIDRSLEKLSQLQQQVERLRGLLQMPFDFSRISAQPVNQLSQAVKVLAGNLREADGEQKRLLDKFSQLKTVSTTTRSSAEGEISVLAKAVGPYGSGLSGTKSSSGVVTITEDSFKARKEAYDAELAAVKNWADGQRAAEAQRKAAAAGALVQADRERAMFSDLQYRNNGRATFQAFAAQPGVQITTGREIDPATNSFTRYSTAVNKATGETLKFHEASGKLAYSSKETGTVWGEMLGNIGKVGMWTVATGAVFGTISAVKGAIQTYAEFEKQTVMIARVGDNLGSTQEQIRSTAKAITQDILDLKVAYGSTGTEALQAGVIFTRMGQSSEIIRRSVESTLQVAKLTGMSAESAAKLLEALQLQFQLPQSELPRVVDQLVKVDTVSRVTMSDLLEAGSRTAGVWREAGGTLEQMVAATAVVADRTGRTGAEIGNAFKFISSRLATPETQLKIFNLSGIEMVDSQGKVKPIIQLLDELASKWNSLTEAQQQELTVEIAGARQRNILQALLDGMKNLHRKEAEQLHATGEAARQTGMELDTLSEKWNRFKASMENTANQAADSPAGGAVKFAVDEARKTSDAFGLFFKAMKGGWEGMKGNSEALGANPNDLPAIMRNSPMRAIAGFVKVYYDRISGLEADRAKLKEMEDAEVTLTPVELALPKESESDTQSEGKSGALKRVKKSLKELEDQTKVKLEWDDVLGISRVDVAQRKLKSLKQELASLDELYNSVSKANRDSVWISDKVKGNDRVEAVEEKIAEQEAKVTQEQQKQTLELFKQQMQDEDRISKARSRAQAAMALGGQKNVGESVVAAEIEQSAITQRLRELKDEQTRLSAGGKEMEASEVGREILLQEKALREANANIEIAKYDTLRKQTEEGRRQLEQAEKRLGLLSSEDLARTRIAAGEYARGELKPYSEAQWLNMSQDERQRIEKTLPGLMPNLTFGLSQDQAMGLFTNQEGKMSVANLASTINTASLAAQTVVINGQNGPAAPQVAAHAPAGAMNLTVNLGGLDTKGDQLASQIAMRVQAAIQEMINENAGRVRQSAKSATGFRAVPRSN